MSALLYIGGVLYLLAVIHTAGKRYDADFNAWQYRMHDATVASVFSANAETYRSSENGQTQVRSKAA